MKKLLISAAKSIFPIAIVLLSLNARAFTIIKNPWPSCERPVVLIADSLYGVINTLPLQISMDEKDHNGNMYSVFAMSPAYLGNTTVFTELGTVTLSGILYHVFRFTYGYSLTPGRIGYLNISSKLFSGTWLMRSCPDCNVTPLSCIGRVKAIWAYLQELRTYVGNQPFASLTPGDQLNMTRLIDWYLGIDNPSPSVSDYSNLLDGQNFGNSTVPTSICSTAQHDCDYYKTIGRILDSVAQIVIDQSYNFSLIGSGAQSTLFGCDYFSDYYFMVQSSEDGTQDQVFLIPLKANIPTWILHFADSSVYQLSFSYNYSGGINGLYGGSVYSNGDFQMYNGFLQYEPFQAEIMSSDPDNSVCQGDSIVLTLTHGNSFLWNTGETTQFLTVTQTGNYSVTATDQNNCEHTYSLSVMMIPLPIAEAGNDTMIFAGNGMYIGMPPETGITYTWNPSWGLNDSTSSNPIANPANSTHYVLSAISGNSCISNDTVMVSVIYPIEGSFPYHSVQMNDSMPIVFDRFGNSYALEDIRRGSCTPGWTEAVPDVIAGFFTISFCHDPNSANPFTSNIIDVISQVFTDISQLIVQQPCGATFPQIFIQINAPMGMSTNNPGTASQFYFPELEIFTNLQNENSGVLYGEVWRAINTGVNDPTYMDAMIDINLYTLGWPWNVNLVPNQTQVGQIDLYSVILHEVLHSFGFASLIDANGNSRLFPTSFYSRFDTYLQSNGIDLIDWNNLYSTQFNALLNPIVDLQRVCPDAVHFSGPFSNMFSITNFSQGALSHFGCLLNTDPQVMKPGITPGLEFRVPMEEDIDVLRDLGYAISGMFQNVLITTGSNPGVIGRNDGWYQNNHECSQRLMFELCSNETITVPFVDLLANDINADNISGLQMFGTNGSFTTTTNSFTYSPAQPGLVIFRYIPINTLSGGIGNPTAIAIEVLPCNTLTGCFQPDLCNIICNSDITFPGSPCPINSCYNGSSCEIPGFPPPNWMYASGSPDFQICPASNPPNPNYIRMWANFNGFQRNSEGVLTNVNIVSGHNYTLTYFRRRGDMNLSVPLQNFFIRLIGPDMSPVIIPTPMNIHEFPGIPTNNQLISHEQNIIDQTWQQVTVCFQANSNYTRLWLYPLMEPPCSTNISTSIYVDRIVLVEDTYNAGPDVLNSCNAVLGVDACEADNASYSWINTNSNTQAGTTQQILQSVNETTLFEVMRSYPPNPGTVIFPPQDNNCTLTDNVTITMTAPLTPVVTSSPSCNTPCDGSATVTGVLNGTGPFSYIWDVNTGNQVTQTATNLCVGNYFVSVYDIATGCSATSEIAVDGISIVSISADINPVCDGNPTTLTASGATSYVWSGGLGTGNPVSVSPAATTTYTVTGTNAGCTTTATITINVNTDLLISISPSTNPICEGNSTTLTASGAISYDWSGGLGSVNPVSVSPTSTTTYTVTGTSAGCTGTASITITVNPNPVVSISASTNPICEGNSTTLTASGADIYTWSGGLGTGNPVTVSPASTTTYNVTGTNAGCTGTASITITVNPNPVVSISASDNLICGGNSTVLTASGADTYSWSGGLGTGNTISVSPASTTTYSVTGDNSFGCSSSATATITVNPDISISFDVSNPICSCNGGALVIVSGGTAPYTYQWSGGIQGPDNYISNLCGGTTYSVTITDANSCTATADVLVNWIEEPPSIAITHSGCYDMCFQNTAFGTPAIAGASYLWDFGDGSTSNLQNPQHSFQDIGYHCVSLSLTNTCGTASQSVPLYVTEYACVCDYTYDFVGPYELQINTTWNSSNFLQGVYITGDLIVPRNTILNIDQIPVYFSPTGRIIVAEDGPQAPSVNGGQLFISNAALLTSLPGTCNKYMWKGIEVWGIPSYNQYIEHGTVSASNDAIIENAHIAVLSGARNDGVICDPSQDIFDLSKSGGVVRLYDAVFDRNGVDVKFLYKQNPAATENKIESSVFRCGNPAYSSLWDSHYSSNNANPYPNTHNPWAGNTMQYQWTGAFGGPIGNSMQSTHAAIEIDHNRGIDIGHNSFYHKEYAIRTSDAQYDVIGNTFNNVQYGIYMLNPSQTLSNTHYIADNTFDMIPGMMGINGTGIFNLCGNLDVINNNQFKNTLYGNCDEAMKFLFSSRYKIAENRFDRYVHGVIANWNFSGLIGPEGSLYEGNYFEGFSTSIETTGANASLALRCNDFYPLVGANIENWVNNAVVLGNWVFTLGNQGINYPDPRALAGNTFNYPTQKEITSSHSYRYYHHDPSIPKFVPVNTPHIISITTPGFPGHYYAVPYSSDMVSCPPLTGTPVPFPNELRFNEAPYDQLLNYKMKTDSLSQVRDVMISQLDRGETSSLLDAVANISDQGILKNLLSDHSPLSDTVLTSIIEHNVFSPGNYKLVMQKNLPVSLNIEPDFFAYLGSMPPGIADQLKALQAVNVNATTPTTIQRQIDESRTSYNLLFNDVLFVLTDSSHIMTDVAIQLLEWDATPESKYLLLSHYLNTGDFVSATHKLSELNALTDPVSAQLYDLYQVLFPLYFSGGDYRNIDSTGLVYIRNLAWSCPETPAVYIARGIIDILLNEKVPACPPETYNRRFDPIVQQNCEKQNPFLGDNYPNPFSQVTKIPYYMPENNTGMIIIRNLIGIELKQFDCSAGFNVIEMNGEDIESGLYLYSLVINGQSNATKKMIIVK